MRILNLLLVVCAALAFGAGCNMMGSKSESVGADACCGKDGACCGKAECKPGDCAGKSAADCKTECKATDPACAAKCEAKCEVKTACTSCAGCKDLAAAGKTGWCEGCKHGYVAGAMSSCTACVAKGGCCGSCSK